MQAPTGTLTAPAAPAAAQHKERDPFFDNAKYLAIVLVAAGHAWEPLRDSSRPVMALYMWVYAFHMPAFIVISGYFSRSFRGTPAQMRKLVTTVAVPYVLFQTAYAGFLRLTGEDPGRPVALLDPWWLTWFLVALFVWRLTTPVWRTVRWPLALALLLSVLSSLSPDIGDQLDLQRVLQFLPFFVAGLLLRPHHFALVRGRRARLLSLPVAAAALAVAWAVAGRADDAWLYHRDSVQELGAPWWAGLVVTPLLFAGSMVLTAAFLALVPGRRTWYTRLGTGTLYGFLLHGFVLKGAEALGLYDPGDGPFAQEPWGALLATLAAAAAVTLLCTAPVRRVFRFAVEPRLPLAFRDDAPRPGSAEPTERRAGGVGAGPRY